MAFITPSDCVYINFATNNTTYNHDICTNFSSDRNGQYEPYEFHSYALDDSLTLRGIPKLNSANEMYFDGDVYKSDGSVERRYGIVTLNGSENWQTYDVAQGRLWRYDLPTRKDVQITNSMMISSRYSVVALNESRKEQTISGSGTFVDFIDSSYNTINEWKASLATNPITIVYELATPTTESASPYVSPQICNEYGTEEYVSAEQNGVTMIVGHNTKYPQNLRKKIEGLPWNFSSLIAPTEATNKATRNYTVGSFLIMNNTLYKVTSAIANGGTITVGSNVTATTIMQEILAL